MKLIDPFHASMVKPRAVQPLLVHVFELTKLMPVQVPDPVAPSKRPVPPVMVKDAASV